MKEYIIIANGQFLAKEIITEASLGKTIIALDGAVNRLLELDITPQIILGDFDSISAEMATHWGIQVNAKALELPVYTGKHGTLIVPARNQNYTDLNKAIQFCELEQAQRIHIICAMGGRLDHQEGARLSLRTYYRPGRTMLIHAENQDLHFARNETFVIHGQPGDKCGFIATGIGKVTSKGLIYESQGRTESICNILAENSAELKVEGEAWIIAPPSLKSQRRP